jgi:hypothetical protein
MATGVPVVLRRESGNASLGAASALRAVVAGCLLGAAAVHFAFAPDHYAESRFHGAFFFLAGWLQLMLAFAGYTRPSRSVWRGVIIVNTAMVLLWMVSRVVGLPFGDDPWVAEPVEFPDTLATVLEVAAVAGAWVLLTGRLGERSLPRGAVAVGGIVLAAALVGTTTASVAPALAGDHAHGPLSHAHSDLPRVHTPSARGDAHGHGPAIPGIEAATGASPCEQSGVQIEGNSAGHGERGPVPHQAITDAATRQLLAQQLTAAREAAMRYPTAADAMAAGYRRITPYIPCIAAHYINFRYVDDRFDPAEPEMLLYDGNDPDARIVGLSYYVRGVSSAPEGFAGPNDPWHQHIGLCVNATGVIGGTNLTAEQCAAIGGRKADGSDAWMTHAWVVPGWESAWGTFSGEHPELGARVPR